MRGDPANVEITEVVYYFAFYCCDKILTRSNLGRKGFLFSVNSQSPPLLKDIRAGTWRTREDAVYWPTELPTAYIAHAQLFRGGLVHSGLGPLYINQ